jgi:hypothetical protein
VQLFKFQRSTSLGSLKKNQRMKESWILVTSKKNILKNLWFS